MKKFSILILVFIVTLGSVNAQIKVKSDGRVYLKGFKSTDDYNNEVSVQIYGPYGSYLANGRLAFGDYGSMANYGGNVFIGEYGTNLDSDMLQLQGRDGIYLTRGTGSDIIGYYNTSSGNKFTFNCDVYSYGTKLTSDERFKTNIIVLDSALMQLKKLNGVSYNYSFPEGFTKDQTNVSKQESSILDSNAGKLTEKEIKSKEFFEKFEKECQNPKGKRLGFIAQDLQKVFPELVEKDSAGYYYVDYVGLIPVIVEALKEQQEIIDAQSLKIKELEARVKTIEEGDDNNLKSATLTTGADDESLITNAFLYQNTPNPFNTETNIRYYIPDGAGDASIYIFNLQGNMLDSRNLETPGDGSIIINGSEFQAGMYVYSLLVNGQEVDTKRMILTE